MGTRIEIKITIDSDRLAYLENLTPIHEKDGTNTAIIYHAIAVAIKELEGRKVKTGSDRGLNYFTRGGT